MGCCSSCASKSSGQGDVLEVQGTPPSIGIPSSFRGSKILMDEADPLVVSGEGAALASAAIEQDAAYWEVKVVKTGTIRLGVARKLVPKELEAGVKPLPSSAGGASPSKAQRSWCADLVLEEGDNIGIAFGHPYAAADVTQLINQSGLMYRGDADPVARVWPLYCAPQR